MPQKIKKRRNQQHQSTSTYRSFRRKAKTPLSSASNTSTRVADKSDSSSSDYDDDGDDGFRNATNTTSTGPIDINIPSTSTGITANGKGYLFRIANPANDSDDDQSIPDTTHPVADSMIRVIRSPPIQNNQTTQYGEDGAGPSTQRTNPFNSSLRHNYNITPNGRNNKLRPQNGVNDEDSSSSKCIEDYASTNSNSLMSSTSDSSSNDSFVDFYSKKRKLNNGNATEEPNNFNNKNFTNASTSSNSGHNGHFETPDNRLRTMKATPDSGFQSLPSPSPSSSRGIKCNGNSFDMMKKIDSIKRNYRKNIQTSDDDSD